MTVNQGGSDKVGKESEKGERIKEGVTKNGE